MSSTRLPGTPRLLRAINDRAALELLLDQGPLTRAQLGELTGLSKVTASQLVDRNTGDMSFAFDLPRWQRGLLAKLREDLKRPVVFENDVNLAAVAESHTGAAKGVDDFVLLWLDRGVGMAVMLGGRLHRGVSGAAGEIGYLPVAGAPVPRDVARRSKGGFKELAVPAAGRAGAREHGLPARSAPGAVPA